MGSDRRIDPSLSLKAFDRALSERDASPVDLVKIRGGLSFNEPFEYFRTLVHRASQHYKSIQAFSPVELYQWHRMEQRPIRDLLAELHWAGATRIGPGGGEILIQSWRDRLSPYRIPAETWLEIAQLGWEVGLPPTAMVLVGDWLTIEDYQEHLHRLAGYRWDRVELKLYRHAPNHPELEGSHLLKILTLIELARSYLGPIPLVVSDPQGTLSNDAKLLMTGAGCQGFYQTLGEISP